MKTNPIKPNFNPKTRLTNPKQTQFQPKNEANKPNQTHFPAKTAKSASFATFCISFAPFCISFCNVLRKFGKVLQHFATFRNFSKNDPHFQPKKAGSNPHPCTFSAEISLNSANIGNLHKEGNLLTPNSQQLFCNFHSCPLLSNQLTAL